MTDDTILEINIEVTDFNNDIAGYMDKLVQEVLIATADMLKFLIIEQIDSRLFDTIYDNQVLGIVDFGQYKDKWKIEPKDKTSILVTNDDPKAIGIEYGTAPEDHSDLTLEDILSWAKRKNVPEDLARDIYQVIKYERGTVPKPAVRRSLDMISSRSGIIQKAVEDKMNA